MKNSLNKNKLLIITALHGDEPIGVDVMKQIEKELSPTKNGYDWIIGNPKAYKKNVRFIEADLNRIAPGNAESKIYEEKRAFFLINLSKKYSFILDVHGTVAYSGIVTIITYPTIQNIILASMVKTDKNIVWYSSKSAKKGPVSQYTSCPAIEIECGPEKSSSTAARLKKTLEDFVKNSRAPFIDNMKDLYNQEFYVVYGKRDGKHDSKIRDFKLYHDNNESYYPFLSNQYPRVLCYKTRKFDLREMLIYRS